MISMEELVAFKLKSDLWLREGVDFSASLDPLSITFYDESIDDWDENRVSAVKQELLEKLGESGIRAMRDARNLEIQKGEAELKASARAKLVAGQPLTEQEAATVVL
jgi:hypothetical protein